MVCCFLESASGFLIPQNSETSVLGHRLCPSGLRHGLGLSNRFDDWGALSNRGCESLEPIIYHHDLLGEISDGDTHGIGQPRRMFFAASISGSALIPEPSLHFPLRMHLIFLPFKPEGSPSVHREIPLLKP